jgi:hypothetical protein
MKGIAFATGVLLSAGVCAAEPVNWAATVVTSGVETNAWNGQLNAFAGSYGGASYTVTPFDAAFATTAGGSYGAALLPVAPGKTVELSFGANGYAATTAAVNNGFNIGIQAGVGLTDTQYGSGVAGTTGGTINNGNYTNLRAATVAVSQDGTNWKYLQYNGVTGATAVEPNPADPSLYQWVPSSSDASLIAFDVPTNYFNSTSIGPDGVYAPDTVAAGTPVADFSKPFPGTLASFSNESWNQVITTLDGSSGGTWLNVAGTGLNSIDYIQFTVPASATNSMYIQAVAGVVPEPATDALLLSALVLLPLLRRRGKIRV